MHVINTSYVIIPQYHIHHGVHFEFIDITIDSNIAVNETLIRCLWYCTIEYIDKIFSHRFDYEIFDVKAKIAIDHLSS